MARQAPRTWGTTVALLPHIRELGLMAGTYFAYMYTRKLVFSDVERVAFSNARRIVDLERSLGCFWEPHWQQWTLDSVRGAVIFFNWAYIMTFWPIVITTAVITYSLDRSRYFYFRNVVLLTFAFALIVFMLFPLAPPRMLPAYFVDTIDQLGPSFYASREAANYYNAFAAMPSLHFTWTAVLGVMFFRLGPTWLKVLGVAYPTMTLLAITITGNHYIVDAVVGAVIAAVSIVAVHYFYRWRDRRRARRLALEAADVSLAVEPWEIESEARRETRPSSGVS